MKKKKWSIGILVLLLFTVVLQGHTVLTGFYSEEPFYINFGSFAAAGINVSQSDLIRASEVSLNKWNKQGLTGKSYYFAGSTNSTGCSFFTTNNHIYAVTDVDGSVAASHLSCFFGSYWRIKVRNGVEKETGGTEPIIWGFGLQTSGQTDYQSVITHEIGHTWFDHINTVSSAGSIGKTESCTMNTTIGARWQSRNPCFDEIERPEFEHTNASNIKSIKSNKYNTVDWTDNWSKDTNLLNYGFGGGSAVFTPSNGLVKFMFTNTKNATHQNRFCNYSTNSNCSDSDPSLQSISFSSLSVRRPTIAIDTKRNNLWAFWIQSGIASVVSGQLQRRDFIMHASSENNGVTWTNRGIIMNTSPGGNILNTREAVGATYDLRSDSIVLVYQHRVRGHSSTSELFDFVNQTITGDIARTGDLVLLTRKADGLSPWKQPYLLTGQISDGAPAVACEQSNIYYQCEVIHNGVDPNRATWRFRFDLQSNGTVFGHTGGTDTGSRSNYDHGLVNNGISSPGIALPGQFMTVHTGRDGFIYTRVKQDIGSPWDEYPNISFETPVLSFGTPVLVHRSGSGYNIFIQQ